MNVTDKAAVIKDLVRCIKTGDNKKLKLKTIQWISDNYPLAPYDVFPFHLNYVTRKSDIINLSKFYSWFDAFDFVNSEIMVNYSKGWIKKWIKDKTTYCQDSKNRFNDRVEILNEVRKQIEVKFYRIKYSELKENPADGRRFRRCDFVHALDIKHAVSLFMKGKSNSKVKIHHVKADSIRPYVEII